MADTEKDRFGNKLRDKERAQEDEYFARRDRELIEKARQERREEATRRHSGPPLCPRCGTALVERALHGATVDECSRCGGLWLDKGELEHIARREQEGWLGRLLRARG